MRDSRRHRNRMMHVYTNTYDRWISYSLPVSWLHILTICNMSTRFDVEFSFGHILSDSLYEYFHYLSMASSRRISESEKSSEERQDTSSNPQKPPTSILGFFAVEKYFAGNKVGISQMLFLKLSEMFNPDRGSHYRRVKF